MKNTRNYKVFCDFGIPGVFEGLQSEILKGLTAGAADPDPVAFEHAFDIDHVIDPVCRFRRRLRIRMRGR